MKHGHSLAVGVLAMFLAACGGGGSHDTSSNVATTTPRVEAVVTGNSADPLYRYQDPLSIESGDTVQFQLVRYDDSGNREVLPTTWRSSDTQATYGAITSNTGSYAASTRDSGNLRFIATARYNDVDYSTFYRVNPRQVRVAGRLLAEGTLTPIDGATIDVYGPSNASDSTTALTRLASVQTSENGTFRISVRSANDNVASGGTPSPLYFTIRAGTIPQTGYFDSFVFRGQRFDSGFTACLAPFTSTDGSAFVTGEQFMVDSTNGEAETNGTILLTPNTGGTRPSATGCISPG